MGPKHRANVKDKATPFKCPRCGNYMKTENAFKSHMNRFHRESISTIKVPKVPLRKVLLKKNVPKNFISKKRTKKLDNADKSVAKKATTTANKEPKKETEIKHNTCLTVVDLQLEAFVLAVECAECKFTSQRYKDMVKHIDFSHRESLISLFLPNNEVFETWLSNLEKTTNTLFYPKSKMDFKQYYVCTAHIHTDERGKLIQCPAMIISRHYEKGVQVFFLKSHKGHEAIEYEPDVTIQKYLVSADLFPKKMEKALGTKGHRQKTECDKMQKEIKDILKTVMNNCSRLEYNNLEDVLDLAKSMQTLIDSIPNNVSENGHIDTDDENIVNESKIPEADFKVESEEYPNGDSEMNDADANIKVFEVNEDKSEQAEIKSDGGVRADERVSSPLIVNTYTISDSQYTKGDVQNPQPKQIKNMRHSIKNNNRIIEEMIGEGDEGNTPKNFNDSYKTFIEKHTGKKLEDSDEPKLIEKKSKNRFTTKKVKSYTGKKTINNLDQKELETKNVSLFYNKGKSAKKKSTGKVLGDNNIKVPSIVKRKAKSFGVKKNKVKTKLGQYSPKKAAKSAPPAAAHAADNHFRKTKFQEYEVQEREDDCNILILKF